MTLKAVCRVGDTSTGTCQVAAPGHPRAFIGTWTTGSSLILSEGIAVIRVGDTGITDCGHTIQAAAGSNTAKDNGISIHRVNDAVIVIGGGSGVSTTGSSISTAED